jgi:hypothetical protein
VVRRRATRGRDTLRVWRGDRSWPGR